MNDIATSVTFPLDKCLYVDDLVIYMSGHSMQYIQNTLQTHINKISNTAEQTGYRISASKTHVVHFCRKRSRHTDPKLHLGNAELEVRNSTKFLGITFDKKLTWHPHIQDLTTRCKKVLNLMKCLAHINWGADRKVLLMLYTSLIRSRIDYGSIIYSSMKKSYLRALDSIQNTAIRLATGAFRTSPVISLQVDASIPPLEIRRERQILTYSAKIWSKPNHINYMLIFELPLLEAYQAKPSHSKPLTVRCRELMREYNITFPAEYSLGRYDIPPWTLIQANIILDLTILKKGDTPTSLYVAHFNHILENFIDHICIYTDGSKNDNGVGCAIFVQGHTYSWTMPPASSIYTAEIYAIWQALLLISHRSENTFIICSDSLSSLENIKQHNYLDPLVQAVCELIHHVHDNGKSVTLIWTPGHVGIFGNQQADEGARAASLKRPEEGIPIRPDDINIYIKDLTNTKWQTSWETKNAKLREIKPSIKPFKYAGLSRRESIVLTRLRIGHTNLTSSYLLLREDQPQCNTCHLPMTIKHIIEECTIYERILNQMHIPRNLNRALEDSKLAIETIIKFCKTTQLYNRI